MLSEKKRYLARCATVLATCVLAGSLQADDTEIFFGQVENSEARPNVLFIIDTSGSMDSTVPGTGKSRLDNMKDGMFQILDELNNVNVGLMRFTNPGGPVLYPVTYINEESGASRIISTLSRPSHSDDDGLEIRASGAVVLDGESISLVSQLSAGNAASTEAVQVRVSSNNDDAEQDGNDRDDLDRNDDELDFLDEQDNSVGLRFQGVGVPRGATIVNAFIRLVGEDDTDRDEDDPVYIRIAGEPRDSGNFGSSNGRTVRDRSRTNAKLDWTISESVDEDETVDSPNISNIVHEIINHSSWDPDASNGEDDMVFFFDPVPGRSSDGNRKFRSRNDDRNKAPQLNIDYQVGSGTPAVNQPIDAGFRFTDVNIPRGAKISSAYVQFTAARGADINHDWHLAVENTGDAAPFQATTRNISSRNLVTGTVRWFGDMDVAAGDTVQTPELKTLLQNVVNRSDWCGGNALVLLVEGDGGVLPVEAYDAASSGAATLVVNYEEGSVPAQTCFTSNITLSTAGSSSDAEQDDDDDVDTNDDEIEIDEDFWAGLRFDQLPLERGDTLLSAHIELTASKNDNGSAEWRVYAELSDDADTYSSRDGNISERNYGSDYIRWDIDESWSNNSVYRSPDISSLLQRVVNRQGWQNGNAIAVSIFGHDGSDRKFQTYDENPAYAPRLILQVRSAAGSKPDTVREKLKTIVSDLNAEGWTPIQDTLYEAARYYTGQSVNWGRTRGNSSVAGGPFHYARVTSELAMVPGTFKTNRPNDCSVEDLNDSDCREENISGIGGEPMYQTPIVDPCQIQNHIILMTDGEANYPHSTALIRSFTGDTSCDNNGLDSGEFCVKELVAHMANEDIMPDLNLQQTVRTHTVGFNFSSDWLEDVAEAGEGISTTASTATELVSEIRAIIGDVLKTDSSFVAPVAAINEFNQLSHLNQLYFAVFRPDNRPRWKGNLKRYTLNGDGEVLDVDDNIAIDAETGFFSTSAQSFWSSEVDGANVDKGGAAEKAPNYDQRKLYTYIEQEGVTSLASTVNRIRPENTALTQDMFGLENFEDSAFEEHIDWVRGRDVDDEDEDNTTLESRFYFGDPLHSRPLAITYGGSEAEPDVELFYGSNAGVVHAINGSTGVETFAFIPEALLPQQATLRSNPSSTNRPYGMDLTLTSWVLDANRDGIKTNAGDKVYLYAGMRRGGRNYYALDATDRANPKILWTIKGGEEQANGDDFGELGQTWSRPIKTMIRLKDEQDARDVLIFSGGYDPSQDDAQSRERDTQGRAVYIVDANDGSLVWAGGHTDMDSANTNFNDMDYSFPSTPSVIDVTVDGLADSFFLADTGGQLWRFDITNGSTADELVKGGVIADLGVGDGENSTAENRRFFTAPSIALVKGPAGPELAVVIGSGFRPSPLGLLAENKIFMIRQADVFGSANTYPKLTLEDLYNASDNILATASGAELNSAQALLNNASGWYVNLTVAGEKALSAPLIANDKVIVTTYAPGGDSLSCRPAAGTSRAYILELEDGGLNKRVTLETTSIVDQAAILAPQPDPDPSPDSDSPDTEAGDNDIDVGASCPQGRRLVVKLNGEDGPIDNWCNNPSKTYWMKAR
ncbi:MAG: PilC/PilY family type IV pilus protein [Halieaceae bacterium]|uniref:PilC/PilY family type IV pilus protein n=1 Tax=Haliea alexandrii TaxID=2448162 RepID=UPI000F0B52F5|nr:PilC/PilY family type IV pilus protein [Haliea alexandrii]MCR9185674.1 PilC/PilY family type IV pilus protein [Halieaceae bacterium]